MHIFTRTGDAGTTGIIGSQRLSKADPRLHAYGTVDELNALLGVTLTETKLPELIRNHLLPTQHLLFTVGTDLATLFDSTTVVQRMDASHTETVEKWILHLEKELPPLKNFILPSGSRPGALLHQARTVCRRAERWVVALGEQKEINQHVQIYLNRLGDYLFLAARKVNVDSNVEEIHA
ncbi:ATP:cob(I)alamin adenosyltransferase [Candidatus Peregrinibacteria bacterium CG10_big_fil_rev_8_21_14_0_10_49_16]|nr:MAG: ATP:cob(I)alamin adenosyltransferase [Candidatus Peregrinibacteria bacterium CG22_combo_CG10-13_8_21_14_all_49_11]PIR52451.1 MAG: ATP:cob(I)alamin adenosyltransferase [Candidatus Peregrinibacteria bacterium CG10_big_fil_rev_8_21_14_0_10_49_16]